MLDGALSPNVLNRLNWWKMCRSRIGIVPNDFQFAQPAVPLEENQLKEMPVNRMAASTGDNHFCWNRDDGRAAHLERD